MTITKYIRRGKVHVYAFSKDLHKISSNSGYPTNARAGYCISVKSEFWSNFHNNEYKMKVLQPFGIRHYKYSFLNLLQIDLNLSDDGSYQMQSQINPGQKMSLHLN